MERSKRSFTAEMHQEEVLKARPFCKEDFKSKLVQETRHQGGRQHLAGLQ